MLLENANQTAIVNFLNENKKKRSGRPFTAQDVQGYVRRGRLPNRIGGNRIVKIGTNCKTFNIE